MTNKKRLIETDNFDFEFLSQLAERESWRKEIHRPIYYLHKWWAKRLGSVFRGILLGSILAESNNLSDNFYLSHNISDKIVFDPFMGSGTTIGEAHKLGLTTLGRDINPIAVESIRVALGPMNKRKIDREFEKLAKTVGQKILKVYRSTDSKSLPCDVLYYFWVMQASCPECNKFVDFFPSWIIARNAYPNRKPKVQILCPRCGDIFPSTIGAKEVNCNSCHLTFSPESGNAKGSKAKCPNCNNYFQILSALNQNKKPEFRLYGKLILTKDGNKEYLKITEKDLINFKKNSEQLHREIREKTTTLPGLDLEAGHNTTQAISYGFKSWKDFFNDRQLLCLSWLNKEISKIEDEEIRDLFLLTFSSALEFNNLFASYKGEGTGAVRHMFSHHILKPERTPIEANVWGTPKSSGSFSNLFRNRIDRAIAYRQFPTEISGGNGTKSVQCSSPFTGEVTLKWPSNGISLGRKIYLSCDDSSVTNLQSKSVDLIVTDPPFFDNVFYSELADFFFAWQQLFPRGFIKTASTTRTNQEVQDSDPINFTNKLQTIFQECNRVLKDNGLLVFTYHHSRNEGWRAVAGAILNAGFYVVNSHPVKSEMSVATPKSQAKEPIQLDIVIVCRKDKTDLDKQSFEIAIDKAEDKIARLQKSGFSLSKNDKKVVTYGQLLTCLRNERDIDTLPTYVDQKLSSSYPFANHMQTKLL